MFAVAGIWILSIYNILSIILWYIAQHILQKGYKKTAHMLGTIEVVIHAVIATVVLGWNSGFHYYIICIICFSFFTPNWRELPQLFANIIAFFIYYALSIYLQMVGPVISYNEIGLHIFNFMNMANTMIVLAFYAFIYKMLVSEYNRKLKTINAKLSVMADTDPLTSLFNRRGILSATNELAISNADYVLALCDIDDFKMFNEHYGHECGDYVLKGVADIISNSVSGYGTVGRWGGEEFLIILSQCDSGYGKELIENIQKKVEASFFHYDDQNLSVTITFGYTISNFGENLSEAVKRADKALRYGKTNGKNCTVKE
jgi:diguanylate cyclase (GGDEF)-like protein